MARFPLTIVLVLLAAPPAVAGGLVDSFTKLAWSPYGIQYAGQFGFAVAPAGDVNKDGFGDVLVGAPFEDNTQFNEGRVHLFLGSAEGLAPTPARIFTSAQANAYAGWCVSPAGDVNGDGYADMLVAAPFWDTGADSNAGKVMVYHGGANLPYLPTYERFSPAPADDQLFGRRVATAGDVNGDGYDDVIVATPYYAEGGFASRGAVFVFQGGPAGLAATPARTWIGPPESGQFGASVATAGDINGDGYADVIVGAPAVSIGMAANGAAYVYLGSAAGIAAAPDTVITGTEVEEFCGQSVANAGDVNGDGYADVLIGSPQFGAFVGRCRLVYGGPNGLASGIFLANSEVATNEGFGNIVATLGDLNGDGFADFGVTSRYTSGTGRGRIVVYRGGRTQVSLLGDILTPGGTTGYFGNDLATAGDADGDGVSEILVGTEDWSIAPAFFEGRVFSYAAPIAVPQLSPGWPRAGAQAGTGYGSALAFLPQTSGSVFPSLAIGDPGYNSVGRISFHPGGIFSGISGNEGGGALLGTVNFQQLGARLVDAGDMNRDGYTELVASSPTLDNGAIFQAGRVDLYAGSTGGLQPAALVLAGSHDFDRVGSALAGRGDVNGDGYQDLLVGAREWNSNLLADCGKAWLFLGSPTGPAASPWTREGTAATQGLGASVALCDLDGDGYSDAVIGSSLATAVPPLPGKVEVFFGGPTGLPATPGLVYLAPNAQPSFGATVAPLGDVNGDAICDLGVAAPLDDDRGRVYVYEGTLGRSQATAPIHSYAGQQAGGRFGAAIAGGGDVDGDGFGDLAIGSPGYDSGVVDDGRVDVYRGAPQEPSGMPYFTLTNGITGARLGEAIAPLADCNLDGFADLVVGAPGAAGRVYAMLGGGGPGHFDKVRLFEPNIAFKRRVHPARLDDTDQVQSDVMFASAAGRARVGVEFEVVTQNEPFTGVPTQATGIVYDTDAPDDGAGLLSSVLRAYPMVNLPWPGRGYHLRTRFVTRSPFFPRSRWITPEAHTSGDLDVWTAGAVVDAAAGDGAAGRAGLRFVAPNPAPGDAAARVSFALPRAGRVRVDLYDVRGAHVRRLLDADVPAGPGECAWDGADAAGRRAPAGIYFVEFAGGGRTDRARIVRLP